MTAARRRNAARPAGPRLEYERRVLDNGLVVLVHANRAAPIVSIRAHVEGGLRFEPEDKAGVSYLTGRLLDGGTADRSALELASDMEHIAAILSTSSQGAKVKLRRQDLDRGLEALADVLWRPVFPEDRVAFEKNRHRAALLSSADDARRQAREAFDDLVYGKHPYHRPAIGYVETAAGLDRDDVVGFHASTIVPGNTTLIVAGDVDVESTFARIEDSLGPWPAGPVPVLRTPRVRRQRGRRRRWIEKDREQVHVYLGHLSIRRVDDDFHALRVLDEIFGGGAGFTDRISRRLRDQEGLAYSVHASITHHAGKEPGVFYAYIGTSPDKRDQAVAGFLEEIERIRTEKVSRRELADARNYLTSHYVFGFETNGQRASQLLLLERYGFGADHFVEYPRRLAAVTADQILEAAARHLDAENYSLAVAGPKG